MDARHITEAHLAAFAARLRAEERAPSTVEKYCCDVRGFARWLDGGEVTREVAAVWKAHLLAEAHRRQGFFHRQHDRDGRRRGYGL